MDQRHILVVEDNAKTAESLLLYLGHAGFDVSHAADGRRALELARTTPPDLVLLDVMLPELDGLAVCRALRAESSVPVILLTARSTENDKLRGLDLGADDYITKPFSPREVVARVRAVLRRAAERPSGPPQLSCGRLIVDRDAHQARVDGREVKVTPVEFRLLEALVARPGRVFSRSELAERALGEEFEGSFRTVDAHIKNLRKKLGAESSGAPRIATVHGVGYKLELP